MILIFLHGKGADETAYYGALKALAERIGAEFLSFNAPFQCSSYKNRFLWYNKFEQNGRRDAIEEEYLYSLNYIKEKLQNVPCSLSDVILIGHSQGGGMAAAVALALDLKCAVSICGDLPYNLTYKSNSKTPIYWLEGGLDKYITQERKDSYKILENLGVDLHYYLVSDCTHTDIQAAFDVLMKILN